MYRQGSVGELVFSLRKYRGVTQDYLSEKVDCSPGTISRIENGSQVPTGPMLRRIMEQLGEPGFFGDYYLEKEELKIIEIQLNLLESYELKQLESFERYFDLFKSKYKNDSVYYKRVYRLMRILYMEWLDLSVNTPPSEYVEIVRMTWKDFCMEAVSDKILMDYIEIIVINNLAISLIKCGETVRARKLLAKIVRYLDASRVFLPKLIKAKASIYNNLAICENELGNEYGAMMAIEKAIRLFSREGGMLFGMKLLRTRFRLLEVNKRINACRGDYFTIKQDYCYLSKEIKKYNIFKDFIGDSCCIRVF